MAPTRCRISGTTDAEMIACLYAELLSPLHEELMVPLHTELMAPQHTETLVRMRAELIKHSAPLHPVAGATGSGFVTENSQTPN